MTRCVIEFEAKNGNGCKFFNNIKDARRMFNKYIEDLGKDLDWISLYKEKEWESDGCAEVTYVRPVYMGNGKWVGDVDFKPL